MKFPKLEIDDGVIIALAKKYNMAELSLFGSILRSDFNDKSDIDILVKFNDTADYSLFDIFRIKEDFEKVLGKKVDLVEKDSLRNPYRRENILKNAKVIYEV
jgi:uncharacterized protein